MMTNLNLMEQGLALQAASLGRWQRFKQDVATMIDAHGEENVLNLVAAIREDRDYALEDDARKIERGNAARIKHFSYKGVRNAKI